MKACPKYARWIGADGFGSYCEASTNKLEANLEGHHHAINPDCRGADFALVLLNDIELQWRIFFKHIDKFMSKLVSVANFSVARAWFLEAQGLAAFFEVQVLHRDQVKLVTDISTP